MDVDYSNWCVLLFPFSLQFIVLSWNTCVFLFYFRGHRKEKVEVFGILLEGLADAVSGLSHLSWSVCAIHCHGGFGKASLLFLYFLDQQHFELASAVWSQLSTSPAGCSSSSAVSHPLPGHSVRLPDHRLNSDGVTSRQSVCVCYPFHFTAEIWQI